MAVGIYLNFEKLSLQIIKDNISKMTDDNTLSGDINPSPVDDEKFLNNLYYGSVAATFIVNLYETTLNTIVSKKLECIEPDILKTSHNVKLQLICTMFGADFSNLKSDNSFSIVKSIVQLRNDITHYKYNEVCMGHYISTESKIPMGTSKLAMADMFTKTYMEKCFDGVVDFLNILCKKCGLVIYKDCRIIDCDGRDALCEYVVCKDVYDECMKYRLEEADVEDVK